VLCLQPPLSIPPYCNDGRETKPWNAGAQLSTLKRESSPGGTNYCDHISKSTHLTSSAIVQTSDSITENGQECISLEC